MADGWGDKLSGKAGDQSVISSDQIGKRQLNVGQGALFFEGEFIEYRNSGRKGPPDFAFSHRGLPTGFGHNMIVGNMPVSGAADDFLNNSVLLAESCAEYGYDWHLIRPFLGLPG